MRRGWHGKKSVLSAFSLSTRLWMKAADMPRGDRISIDCSDDECFQDAGTESKEPSGEMPELFGSNK